MFKLPHEEKEAFFGLLDQYFEARPHLLPTTAAAAQSAGRATSAGSSAELDGGSRREDLQRAGQFAASPVRQTVTGMAAGRALGNKALGNAAASTWANHHQSQKLAANTSGRAPPPPAPSSASKPQGVAGLVTGRKLGPLHIGSKSPPPAVGLNRQTSASRVPAAASGATLPPPIRRGVGVVANTAAPSASPPPALQTEQPLLEDEGLGYAEALYDYGDASDPDDLVIVEGERIVLLERISDDWWRAKKTSGGAETGIVPTSYVRQL